MAEKMEFDKISEDLKKKGFKEQRGGSNYMNGEYGTNFLSPSGEMIHLSQNTCPDEEVIEDLFGKEAVLP